MQATQRQSSTLPYLAVHPDDYVPDRPYPMIILLHGFGAHMGDLAPLAPAIDPCGYIYICPNAPIPFQLAPGATGYGWTPPRDMRDVRQGIYPNEDLERAAQALATLINEVTAEYSTPDGDIILSGFSQGGMMTYRCGLPAPDRFRGLAILSGTSPDPAHLRPLLPHDDRSQPIFVAHGDADAVLPVSSAHDALTFLRQERYHPLYKEYPDMAHEISQDTLTDLAAWIKQTLPPAAP